MATAAVDSAAVFLYTLFALDQRWSRAHAEKIRKNLGPFPASAANRACESVKRIAKLSPEKLNDEAGRDVSPKESSSQDKEMKKEFGNNVVFRPPRNLCEEVAGFTGEKNGGVEIVRDSLSEDEAAGSDAFSQAFLTSMSQKSKTNGSSGERVKSKPKPSRPEVTTGDPAPYSSEWLSWKLRESCCGKGGMNWRDLYTAVFDVLSSPQDNSAIQGEVRI